MSKQQLKINSIFGGKAPSRYFGAEDTFDESIAIDPDFPIVGSAIRTSGFAVPIGMAAMTSTNVTSPIIRQITHPKDNLLWTVQTNGRVVIFTSALAGEILIGAVAGDNATWAEYYNNYIYIFGTGASKDDVSRVGPLNTVPYDGQSGNFTVGLTVTGATSGATGLIVADVDAGATGTLTLTNITGHFQNNEAITDTSTGAAVVNRTDASLITDNVWKGATLGSLTALSNTKYPTISSVDIPNHVAKVHGDGSLYFCDFGTTGTTIAGQGVLHRINTKKVNNEGDNNGTTVPSGYNVLDLPFGFYPTAIESMGTLSIILGNYSVDVTTNQGKSAFVIWNTTNTTSFSEGPIYLSDPFATALLNVNGVIHIWSGNGQNGVRLSKYLGGESVSDLVYFEEGFPPFAGAVDTIGNKIVWGGITTTPSTTASVWTWGSKDNRLPGGLHNIIKTTSAGASPLVTSLKFVQQSSNIQPKCVVAWRDNTTRGIDAWSATGTLASYLRWTFNIGQKFNILKMRIPFGGAVAANTTITPKVWFDDLSSSASPTVINNTNFPASRHVIYKTPELKDYIGKNNFTLEFNWTGTNPLPIAFPILIEIERWEDESDK